MGRVFKHNFTYADEAGRNVSLVYEAEHGEHVRIVPLDDEAGLESFGGNVTSADIVNMTFASAAHADSFHARVAPGGGRRRALGLRTPPRRGLRFLSGLHLAARGGRAESVGRGRKRLRAPSQVAVSERYV